MSTRRERGLTQNIFLVKLDVEANSLIFHVLGTSRHVYKVTCAKARELKCSCPDHSIRKRTCKHMYFVCEKVLQIPPFDWPIIDDVAKIGKSVVSRLPNLHVFADDSDTKWYNEIISGEKQSSGKPEEKQVDTNKTSIRNDECCVCLCDIDSEASREDIMVCSTCNNGIHAVCWNKWSQVNGNNRCVYCRTKVEKKKGANAVTKSGWGVLLI
jgi:hypothetical protein